VRRRGSISVKTRALPRGDSEVGLHHRLVCRKLVGRQRVDHPAFVHDVDEVGNADRKPDILLDKENRKTPLLETQDQLLDFLPT
jgi:hypothetical protein